MGKYGAVVSGILILVLVNWAIYVKERHLTDGRLIYLELAPVDPRSLMQGDYMALRFAMGNDIRNALRQRKPREERALEQSDNYVIAELDENGVAHYRRLTAQDTALAENELRLHYRVRNGRVHFATNAFFFQEGHARRYEAARYGQFRVNDKGEPLLVALHDDNLELLGETQR